MYCVCVYSADIASQKSWQQSDTSSLNFSDQYVVIDGMLLFFHLFSHHGFWTRKQFPNGHGTNVVLVVILQVVIKFSIC